LLRENIEATKMKLGIERYFPINQKKVK